MGCSLGALKSKHKSVSNSSPIVNGRLSNLGSGPRCTRNAVQEAYLEHRLEMDDRCPLSDRQLYTLMKSWKAISRNMSQTAINMFVRYRGDSYIIYTNAHEFVRLYIGNVMIIFNNHNFVMPCSLIPGDQSHRVKSKGKTLNQITGRQSYDRMRWEFKGEGYTWKDGFWVLSVECRNR